MKYKILIAEDEPTELNYLCSFIRDNFSDVLDLVAECHNGDIAITKAMETNPDIALLDIEMPKKNGIEVSCKLTEHNPSIMIAILTAYDSFDYARSALRIGVFDYLLKPYQDDQLSNLLSRMLSKLEGKKKDDLNLLLKNLEYHTPDEKSHPITRMALEYIQQHYMEKISLEIMSDELCFSSSYISKCLKKYLNTNFNNILKETRCNEAAKLLLKGNMTVNEVSYKVGFSDPNYFYKCFKETMGIQPGKYYKVLSGRIDTKELK